MPEPQSTQGPSPRAPYEDRRLVLCLGPGGVGKTTSAAALALAAAQSGRRVVVVTVDPARRLGQALGLSVEHGGGKVVSVLDAERDGMTLDALLLDSAAVFDEIVRAYAESPSAAKRITSSKIYSATRERLGGALEFAAMARVLMLHEAGEHDCIILDTPPTANALEFLSAPQRIRELADNPAAKMVTSGGRLGAKMLGLGGAVVIKALESLGGGDFLRELGAFLSDFAGVIREFSRRGGDFDTLLRSEETGAVVVTSTASFAVREAIDFIARLRKWGLRVDAVMLNRADPPLPALSDAPAVEARLTQLSSAEAQALRESYADARKLGERTQAARQALEAIDPPLRTFIGYRAEVPPDTLDGLRRFGRAVWGSGAPDESGTTAARPDDDA